MQVGELSPDDLIEYQNDAYASIYLAPWRWKALYQKDGPGGVWLTFKRLLRCIRKGRFEMLFVSPNYWKSELTRDPQEIKETVKRIKELGTQKAVHLSIVPSAVELASWKIHNGDEPEGAPGTMFTSAEKDISESILSKETEAHKVVVNHDNVTTSFMTVPGKTILEAAQRANVELPFSCTMGGCGSCKVQLINGEIIIADPHCLDSAELSDGEFLACRSIALTDLKFKINDAIV
jgi:ferredoxin